MRYRFTAHTSKGEPITASIEARNKEEATGRLVNKGYVVDSLQADWFHTISRLNIGRAGAVSLREKLIFTRNLALMIRAGITIDSALSILSQQAAGPVLRRLLTRIQEEVESGNTFSEAMAGYPRVFDELYVNIIAASEKSGTLAESLEHLAWQIKRQNDLKSKIQAALFYPLIVIVSTMAVGLALSIFVLPKITSLFVTFDTQLPLTTRIVVKLADLMQNNKLLVVVLLAGMLAFFYALVKIKYLRPLWHRLFLRLPGIGKIMRDFNLALFTRTLGTLLVSGVPVNQALEITSKTLRNIRYRQALAEMVVKQQSGTSMGLLLSEREDLFPPIVHRMIQVGEESGNLDESLSFLADFHEEELDYATKNISTIIEPVLLILVGIMVAVLALAIITPIYQITGSFQPR